MTPTIQEPRRTRWAGRLAVGLLTIVIAGTITVGTVAASSGDDIGPRLNAACLRIPNLQIRTDRALTRLQADASTKGSLAWLQARIDKATAENHPQLVTVLTNRLAVRTARVAVLEQQQQTLADLAAICAEHGAGG
jgi:hypothetical protein